MMQHRFAAPFVLIIGCSGSGGGSGGGTTPPERATPPMTKPLVTSPDAAVDAVAYAPPFDPCKGPPDPRNIPCNPPPPRPIRGRVIDEKIVDGAVALVADLGAEDGIEANWTAELVTGGGTRIPVGAVKIVSIKTSWTELRLPDRTERVPPEANVRFSPPASR